MKRLMEFNNVECCCGNCCWLYAEDTYGYGACPFQFGEVVNCGDKCKCQERFVSKDEMKRHRFTMLKYLSATHYYKSCDKIDWNKVGFTQKELGAAIEFAYKYIKIFSRL